MYRPTLAETIVKAIRKNGETYYRSKKTKPPTGQVRSRDKLKDILKYFTWRKLGGRPLPMTCNEQGAAPGSWSKLIAEELEGDTPRYTHAEGLSMMEDKTKEFRDETYILNALREDSGYTIVSAQVETPKEGFFIQPVNDGQHWMLAVQHDTSKILYDPLRENQLGGDFCKRNGFEKRHLGVQKDGHSCGDWVISIAKRIMEGRDFSNLKPNCHITARGTSGIVLDDSEFLFSDASAGGEERARTNLEILGATLTHGANRKIFKAQATSGLPEAGTLFRARNTYPFSSEFYCLQGFDMPDQVIVQCPALILKEDGELIRNACECVTIHGREDDFSFRLNGGH